MESIAEINWADLTDAVPAFTTILAMPFTNNIAYGTWYCWTVDTAWLFSSFDDWLQHGIPVPQTITA